MQNFLSWPVAVIGTQWGDEGKGKVVNFLAKDADVICRYAGGNNAGHTVVIKDKKFKLHLLPSGIFYPDKICILGNGMVVDPEVLLQEIKTIQSSGISIKNKNLKISGLAHVIMPYHRLIDVLQEKRRGLKRLGTTGRGVGPAYIDKIGRSGIRLIDLYDRELFTEKLKQNLKEKKAMFPSLRRDCPDIKQILSQYESYADALSPFIDDTSLVMEEVVKKGRKILFEGAQGTMLDIDFGTYPYVTSSHPTVGGIFSGLGMAVSDIKGIIGVAKAYTTRVGSGNFPTELPPQKANIIRKKGMEYGTTTGRPRRCGWIDGVILKYGKRLNGYTSLAITKLDVLSGLEEIKFCFAYKWKNEVLTQFPQSCRVLSESKPLYKSFRGWKEDISKASSWEDLPAAASEYIQFISEFLEIPVKLVSVGPERDQTIII